MKRILKSACCSERDVYVTSGERVLRRSEEWRRYGVNGGSTVLVTSIVRDRGKLLGWDQGQVEMMECGFGWAVEAMRQGRGTERECAAEQEHFQPEEQPEEMRAENRRTRHDGRHQGGETSKGIAGLVRGKMRGVERTRPVDMVRESERRKIGTRKQRRTQKQKRTRKQRRRADHENDEG